MTELDPEAPSSDNPTPTEEEKKDDVSNPEEFTEIDLDTKKDAKASSATAVLAAADPTPSPTDEALTSSAPSAEDTASLLSRTLLLYLTPLLKLGAQKTLDPSDVGPPSTCDRAAACHESTRHQWKLELERVRTKNETKKLKWEKRREKMSDAKKEKMGSFVPHTPNLARVLWYAFGYWRVWVAVFFYIISALLQFVPVLILNDLVRYFETPAEEAGNYKALLFHPWGNVVGLFVFPLLVSVLQTRSQVILNHCAIFIRTAVSTLLFEKALSISASGRAVTSTGQVVNMMSNDTSQLQRFLQFFGFTLVAPFQIVIALVLIYQQVGNATWVGVAFMFFLVPINGVVFGSVSKMRRRVMKHSDARVKMINEILAGIRIIKFYAWEQPFGKEVNRIRNEELKALTVLAYTTAFGFSLIMLSAPIINPILVFAAYIRMEVESLDAATACEFFGVTHVCFVLFLIMQI
jgi:ATP-binding cassette subfamily C (CFTR/MRP) protein 1